MTIPSWDNYFVDMARVAASRSKDSSTRVGAVIVKDSRVISTGYNGMPSRINEHAARWEKPEKYFWVEHAERNAIYSAARAGINTDGASLYLYATSPIGVCADCARGIIQSGIRAVYGYTPDFNRPQYGDQFIRAYSMFIDAGILLYDHTTQLPINLFQKFPL